MEGKFVTLEMFPICYWKKLGLMIIILWKDEMNVNEWKNKKKNKENVHSERIAKSLEGGENYVKNKTNMLTISSIIYFK